MVVANEKPNNKTDTMVKTPNQQALKIVKRLLKDPSYYFNPCGDAVTKPMTWIVPDVNTGGDRIVIVDASPKAVRSRQMMKEMMLALFLEVISYRLRPSVKRMLLADVLKERDNIEEAQYDFIGCVRGVINGTIIDEGDIKKVIGVH